MARLGLLLLVLFICNSLHAQKIACINSITLLQSLPEKVTADSALTKYKTNRKHKVDSLVLRYQDAGIYIQQIGDRVNRVDTMQVIIKYLQDLQAEIESCQLRRKVDIDSVESSLYGPIKHKLARAISYMGRLEKYDFVIDSSMKECMRFGAEDKELMSRVRLVMMYGMKEVDGQ